MTNLSTEIELLHFLVRIADADEGTQRCPLFTFSVRNHLFLSLPPAIAHQVYARGRAEEPLFISVRFLSNFGVEYDDFEIVLFVDVPTHCLASELVIARDWYELKTALVRFRIAID